MDFLDFPTLDRSQPTVRPPTQAVGGLLEAITAGRRKTANRRAEFGLKIPADREFGALPHNQFFLCTVRQHLIYASPKNTAARTIAAVWRGRAEAGEDPDDDRNKMFGYYIAATKDIANGIRAWRMWTMLASNDIKQRYRRSKLGQFWLTIGMGAMILGMGAVYSILFHMNIKVYVPYIAVSLVLWGFISPLIIESGNAFIDNERIFFHASVSPSMLIFQTIYRNVLVLAHNILILPVVFVIVGVGINWNILWLIPGFILVVLNCFWITYFVAIICVRYRDVPQIIASMMQIMFFVTPVMFRPSQLASHAYILWVNPFSSFLQVIRDPILGHPPSTAALAICIGVLFAGTFAMLAFVGRYSWRVVYWL